MPDRGTVRACPGTVSCDAPPTPCVATLRAGPWPSYRFYRDPVLVVAARGPARRAPMKQWPMWLVWGR
eukprot:2273437-Prymnesium_polylepis.1